MQNKNLIQPFANIICTIIYRDSKVSSKEKEKFFNFFKEEFGLNEAEIELLLKENTTDIEEDLKLLKEAFANDISQKAKFMQYLNELIYSDGIEDGEYEVFEMIRRELF